MLVNAFIGQTTEPTDEGLTAALGEAKAAWDELLAGLAQELDVKDHEWRCHSVKMGWALRVKRKARTIVWLAPSRDCFEVLFILGDKAMQAARNGKLPRPIARAISRAVKYPEGSGVRWVVKRPREMAGVKSLAEIKLAN